MLGAAAGIAALKQLQLRDCVLLDGDEGLAAAMSQLPAGLEHLGISQVTSSRYLQGYACFPTGVLQWLQQLTYLELACIQLQRPDEASPTLQPLQALARLVDLQLHADIMWSVTASMLLETQKLTRLSVRSCSVEPGVLAGKTQLQHLEERECYWSCAGPPCATAHLLSRLQDLQALTHLSLRGSVPVDRTIPAAAFSVLTASSKLHHLDISCNMLPAAVWQHVLPAEKQLPHLQELSCLDIELFSGGSAPPLESTRLISCCPGLQSLDIGNTGHSAGGLQDVAELLGALRG